MVPMLRMRIKEHAMMCYSLACLSDTGVVREHNEDNFAFFGNFMPAEHQTSETYRMDVAAGDSFMVGVFDGMGGEVSGEVASYIAAKTCNDYPRQKACSSQTLLEVMAEMEKAVCQEKDLRRVGTMGATATLLAVDGVHARAYVANVGDSIALLCDGTSLQKLSREHTDAQTLIILGITDRKPGLTQYLGMSDGQITINPHTTECGLAPGNVVLLASDGLTDAVHDSEILAVLSQDFDISLKAERLRDLAIEGGSKDNITVLLCEVRETEPDSAETSVQDVTPSRIE